MSWIIGRSLQFRLLVIPIAALLLIVGVAQLRKAPVDALPEFTPPVVEVQTESLGLSAAEVEQLITVPMEQDLLNGVRGVNTIRSDSVPGLSSIVMTFDRDTSVLEDRQLVQERLTQAHALPNVSKPPQMLQPVSSTSRVMMIALSSKKLSPIELSVLARWTVRPRLMGLQGVANVAMWGWRDRQLQVKVDPRRLRDRGVTLSQVIRTTANSQLVSSLTFVEASTPGTGGFIDGPNQRIGVRHILPFGKPANLTQIPIAGTRLRLGDVATVAEDHQPLIGDAIVGHGRGLMLVVQKLPGANTLAVTREVENALKDLRPGLGGVQIDTHIFRPASFIESAIHNLALAALIAGALIVLALVAFLRQWRAVLIGAVAIPLSLIAAGLVLDLMGATINELVVAGLVVALGAVVADAIGDVDGIARRVREQHQAGSEQSLAHAVLEAAVEQRSAAGYATLIALAAIVPVFFSGGLTGEFVHPLALSYVLAVLASMVVALTVTPALSMLVFSRAQRERPRSQRLARLASGYAGALSRIIRTPRPALFTLAGFVVVGVAVLPLLGQSFRPSFKDRDVLVRWNATPSTSLPEMERITARAGAELRSIPGVRDVGAHVGRAVTGDQSVGTGSGEIWVAITKHADYASALRSIRAVVDGYPGLHGTVLTYESDRTAGVLTRPDHSVLLRVYGQDYAILRREAERLRQQVAHVRGVRDPRVRGPVEQPTLRIEVNLASALRHDIKPGDVRRAAGTLVGLLEVGSFFERQKVFAVVVRGVPATRSSLSSVRNLLIDTPGGGHVRVGDVARVAIGPDPVDIRHEGVERYVDVLANVPGRDVGTVRGEIGRRIQKDSFPLEYHAEVLTPSEDVQASADSFPIYAIAAAIGIFLLLQAAFGSWRLAALMFLTLPMALVGGLLVMLAGGGEVSLGAAVGLLTVLAVAARNGLVLITHLQRLGQRPGEKLDLALVVRGTQERLAPILMTTVTTGVALAPFAVLGDVAGNEITHAVALVVLGGLVTTALLNLFVIPAAYLHLGTGAPVSVLLRARRSPPPSPAPQVDLNV
jgi:Cu/Ag efflux pump CusA